MLLAAAAPQVCSPELPQSFHKREFTAFLDCFNELYKKYLGRLVSALYKIARIANDVRVLSSGNPKRIGRRYANKAIGRYVVRRMYLR